MIDVSSQPHEVVLSPESSDFHEVIEVLEPFEDFLELRLLDAVNLCILSIDTLALVLVLIPSFKNVANISKVTTIIMSEELIDFVSVEDIYFTLVNKVDSLKNHVNSTDIVFSTMDILKSKGCQDKSNKLIVSFKRELIVMEQDLKMFFKTDKH